MNQFLFPNLDVCELEPEKGLCKAYIPRWHYDSDTNSCKMFIYGGCLGNSNNFVTYSGCAYRCMKPAPYSPPYSPAVELMLAARKRAMLKLYAKGANMPVSYIKGVPATPMTKGMLAAG